MSLPPSSVSEVANITQWMFEIAHPYVKGRTLEIGSGLGEISSYFIENKIALHLNETDSANRKTLREKFNGRPEVRAFHKIDFHEPDFTQSYSTLFGGFGTVFNLNVLKPPIDRQAVLKIKLLLREGGYFITLIPAYTALYNGLEAGWWDLKTYNYNSIINLLGKDFDILKTRYFNLPAFGPSVLSQTGLSSIVIARKIATTNSNKSIKM